MRLTEEQKAKALELNRELLEIYKGPDGRYSDRITPLTQELFLNELPAKVADEELKTQDLESSIAWRAELLEIERERTELLRKVVRVAERQAEVFEAIAVAVAEWDL
jgi:hypothetical protein